MSKLRYIGKGINPAELNKLAIKLLCSNDIEQSESAPTELNENLLVCMDSDTDNAISALKGLGYKTVTIAYTDSSLNQTIDNSDLEKHGYKFEDGM